MTPSDLPLTLRRALVGEDDASVADLVSAHGGTPLVDGTTATFVFRGDAEDVELKHWMDTFPDASPFIRIGDTATWYTTVHLPRLARVEYKLAVRRRGRRRLMLDPLNPDRARGPFGSNSLATGVDYRRPEWSQPQPSVPAGTLEELDVVSRIFGKTRTVTLYRPAGDSGERLPLLLVHDGSEYRTCAALTTVLDNLIHAGDIVPTRAVLVDPGARNTEYAAGEDHADHLVGEVLVKLRTAIAVDPRRVVAMGASLGGVASLHAAWRHPGTFQGLVLQSGSFVRALGGPFRRGPVFAPVARFLQEFDDDPGHLPGRIHLACGRYDGLYVDDLRMRDQLEARGLEVGWAESRDGHHWGTWRDLLRPGLVHVLGPAG